MARERSENNDAPNAAERVDRSAAPNAVWFKPLMVGFLLLGLTWVLVFYISPENQFPIPGIGAWNLAIGLGIAMIGFLMTTRWR